eukprot:TRINITY_DN2463_c0_g1_i1.p2 TRINITY_DN2463_c0_g1~~TRINITY_DN2463_c0_g1_i1.p2  ORF type:complete len:111 (+),score=6.93 TRINITY_DN2463_c0_g1_i1:81-413(+)
MKFSFASYLEALAVDNGWAAFIIFLLGDPHLLEGGERSKDGSSNPDGVLPFWRSNDLDLDGRWGKGGDFLCIRSASTGGTVGGASGHDSVGIQTPYGCTTRRHFESSRSS